MSPLLTVPMVTVVLAHAVDDMAMADAISTGTRRVFIKTHSFAVAGSLLSF